MKKLEVKLHSESNHVIKYTFSREGNFLKDVKFQLTNHLCQKDSDNRKKGALVEEGFFSS